MCPIEGQEYFNITKGECIPCAGVHTCKNLSPVCPLACVGGCGCPTGTVLDEEANACVNESDCPKGESCDCHMTLTCLHAVPHIMQHLLYQQIAGKGI